MPRTQSDPSRPARPAGPATARADHPPRAGALQWAALAVVLLGAFIGFLDIFIVNVANPAIQAETQATFAQIQLVPAGYTLAYAVGLVLGGRLGDLYGRRRLFLVGTAAFAVTSTACACATAPEFLIGARVAQGLAAALMLPQVLALVQVTFLRQEQRARALGLYGAVVGVGVVAGQIVGGLLLQWDVAGLGWRSVFLVNVPLCVVTFAGALALVPRGGRAKERTAVDLPGAALLGCGLFGLLHPLVVGGEDGWTVPLTAQVCGAVLLLGLFVLWERRVDRSGGAPLLPPRLFAQRGFSLGVPTALFFYGTNGAFVFLLAFYLQRALSFAPWQAAVAFAPMAVCTSVAAVLCGRRVARWGPRVVPRGCPGDGGRTPGRLGGGGDGRPGRPCAVPAAGAAAVRLRRWHRLHVADRPRARRSGARGRGRRLGRTADRRAGVGGSRSRGHRRVLLRHLPHGGARGRLRTRRTRPGGTGSGDRGPAPPAAGRVTARPPEAPAPAEGARTRAAPPARVGRFLWRLLRRHLRRLLRRAVSSSEKGQLPREEARAMLPRGVPGVPGAPGVRAVDSSLASCSGTAATASRGQSQRVVDGGGSSAARAAKRCATRVRPPEGQRALSTASSRPTVCPLSPVCCANARLAPSSGVSVAATSVPGSR